VYLADWGIALMLDAQPDGSHSAVAHELAGTPCYMAPEMLGFGTGAIDERTDVYLLGATLFEIVTSGPPHSGDTSLEITNCILRSQPAVTDAVPVELARIIKCAMHANSAKRYQTAQDFVRAMQEFLTHRGSMQIATEAAAQLEGMREILASPRPELRSKELYELFGAATFGFRAALRSWNNNQDAKAGLRAMLESMIGFELDRGAPEAALALLHDAGEVAPALRTRVTRAIATQHVDKARMAKLTELAADHDPAVGRNARRAVGGALALVGTLAPLASEIFGGDMLDASQARMVALRSVLVLAVVGATLYWARRRFEQTAINRNIAFGVLWGFFLPILLLSAETTIGIPLRYHSALTLFSWAGVMGMLAFSTERWFAVPTLAYLVASTVAIRSPEYRYYATSLANLTNFIVVFFGWSQRRAAPPPSEVRSQVPSVGSESGK
jgi:eukaryotic-like serine/threonine-protein kinase